MGSKASFLRINHCCKSAISAVGDLKPLRRRSRLSRFLSFHNTGMPPVLSDGFSLFSGLSHPLPCPDCVEAIIMPAPQQSKPFNWKSLIRSVRTGLSLRPARQRRAGSPRVACESLEARTLLSVTNFMIEPSEIDQDGRASFVFTWNDSSTTNQTTYELWVDEVLPGNRRNSRVYFENNLTSASVSTGNANSLQRTSTVAFAPGNFIGFIRSHSPDGPGFWHRFNVQIDDDNDSSTPLNNVEKPTTPDITVIREGQGWYGQTSSESRISWVSDDVLHNIWLNKLNDEGRWERHRLIKNVSGSSISFRELAAADPDGWATYFGQIDSSSSDFLETGDYRFFIRSVNRAADSDGHWVGTSNWSSPVDFSYQQVEGLDAKPEALTVTNELRTQISWSPVTGAEGYLVSVWKGPNYSSNKVLYFRTPETSLRPNGLWFDNSKDKVSIEPGSEFFVRVRAIGQDGSPVAFQAGNFASATIRIPQQNSVESLTSATPIAPSGTVGDQMPLLRWKDVGNAESYDIWLTSVETGRRALLVQNVEVPRLHLNGQTLAEYATSIDNSVFSTTEGLAPGRYRTWVRANSTIAISPPGWNPGQIFTVSETVDQILDLNSSDAPEQRQVISPNLVVIHTEGDRSFALVTNGKGESFGRSVLAKYEIASNGTPFRPTIVNGSGSTVLEFADLPMGSNVTDMKVLPDGRVSILSRGSNELRLVDPVSWQVLSTISLLAGSDASAPDAIGLEVLDNNQILVVFNRSDRLRVFDATTNQLSEVGVSGSGAPFEGFLLPLGRGIHVSSVPQGNGIYRLFIATPSIYAVAIYDFDSNQRTLVTVNGTNGQPLTPSRSQTANPFLGGTVVSLKMPSGESRDVFLSADRSGFVTWIDSDSLQFGFIDLADWMPWASRELDSGIYVDPNDNSYDTTRLANFGDQQIAVFSNRANSVMLQLQMSGSGQVSVVVGSASDLFRGTSGAIQATDTGYRLISTANAPLDSEVSQGVGGVQLTATELDPVQDTTYHAPGASIEIVVSNPIKVVHNVGDGVLVQSADSSWKLLTPPNSGNNWTTINWPVSVAWQERTLDFETGFSSTWQHPTTGQHYAVVAVNDPIEPNPLTPVIALLRINASGLPKVIAVYRTPELERVFSANLSADTLILIDRRGGETVTIRNWQNPAQTSRQLYQFHATRKSGSGAIRPGHGIVLNDQTIAMVHDTFPDRGISLFTDKPRTPAIFHPNTTGTFSFDLHRYDDDRIIMATYGGDLVIQNAATGIVELDFSLNQFPGTNIRMTAVESSSYEDGFLTVTSPANQTVAVFKVEQNGSNWTVTPERIFTVPNVVRSIIRDQHLWIIEANQVRRIRL